ncbi:hypothetical protein [Bradyrhizobium sp. USDA 241]|uniref:hypothetical protein n=1 Tax=Bradyrhizobium sp. USDA 241 TaxID=3377725 RepID=UPI003C76BFC7
MGERLPAGSGRQKSADLMRRLLLILLSLFAAAGSSTAAELDRAGLISRLCGDAAAVGEGGSLLDGHRR